jgi:hypothetical protein
MMRHWRNIVLVSKLIFWMFHWPLWLTKHSTRLLVRLIGTAMLARRDSIECRGCGDDVSLLGRWECSWCGWVFDGFGFARCEMCGSVPPFLECQRCGLTVANPTIF